MSAEAMARLRSDRVPSGSPKLMRLPSVSYLIKQAEPCRRHRFRAHLPPTLSERQLQAESALWLQDAVGGPPLGLEFLPHAGAPGMVGIFSLKLHLPIARQRRRHRGIFERGLVHDEAV